MKAALLVGPQNMEIRELPVPAPRAGELLVRIRVAGICGTDYAKYRGDLGGRFPLVGGHEAIGEIAALGPGVTGIDIGARVAIQPNFACGQCDTCQGQRENICPNRVRLGLDVDGVFAEYVIVPRQYVWNLPDGLSDQAAALTEPLAVALRGFQKIRPVRGERVLVYGTGVIGLFYVRLAVLAGALVSAFNTSSPRLETARRLGAARTYRSAADLEAQMGNHAIVYETSGSADALPWIVRHTAPGTRILLTGLPERDSPIPTALITRKELLIQGAMTYRDEFRDALALLGTGEIDPELFITGVCSLTEVPTALAGFRDPGRIKGLVQIAG